MIDVVTPAPTPAPAPLPKIGTPEYDAAMAAKFDAAQKPPVSDAGPAPAPAPAADSQSKPQRPEHIPEKFWNVEKGEVNVEALAKSYAELEKSKAKAPEAPPADPAKAPDDKAAADAVAAAKLDIGKLSTEYAEHGTISDDSYAAFEKVGITREVVDSYIAGQQALADAITQRALAAAGGEQQFNAMRTWAAANLTAAELAAYNAAVNGGPEQAELAVAGLKAKYTASEGSEGKFLGGAQGSTAAGYASWAEVTADMRKPEYQRDPAFRAKVQQKIAVSTTLN